MTASRSALFCLALAVFPFSALGTEPDTDKVRYLCEDENVYDIAASKREDSLFESVERVPGAETSFEIYRRRDAENEESLEVLGLPPRSARLVFFEDCVTSGSGIDLIIQEALAEAGNEDCPITHWVSPRAKDTAPTLSIEPASWRTQATFTYRYSTTISEDQGLWRIGTCRRVSEN